MGVLEIYQCLCSGSGADRRSATIYRRRLGSGLGALYLALMWIVRGGARTIDRQHRDLERALRERIRAEESRAQLAAILEATTDFVGTLDVNGRLLYLNQAGRRMAGLAGDADISHAHFADLCPEWGRRLLLDQGLPAVIRGGVWSGETVIQSYDGSTIPVSQVLLAHKTPAGTIEFLSTIARDISERKRFEEQLLYLAEHDALTGLFNRRRFEQELERQLVQAKHYGSFGALLLLDLDGCKVVNDFLGHLAGDQFLTSLAGLLRTRLRETDISARLGGDEFALILPQADLSQALATATCLLEAVRRHTIDVGGESADITASIGVALFPAHGTSVENFSSMLTWRCIMRKTSVMPTAFIRLISMRGRRSPANTPGNTGSVRR